MLLISPNFDVKSIIFPNFGRGPFPKIVGNGPALSFFDRGCSYFAQGLLMVYITREVSDHQFGLGVKVMVRVIYILRLVV